MARLLLAPSLSRFKYEPDPRKINLHAHLPCITVHRFARPTAGCRNLHAQIPSRTVGRITLTVPRHPSAVNKRDVVVQDAASSRVLELYLVAARAAYQVLSLGQLVRHAAVVRTLDAGLDIVLALDGEGDFRACLEEGRACVLVAVSGLPVGLVSTVEEHPKSTEEYKRDLPKVKWVIAAVDNGCFAVIFAVDPMVRWGSMIAHVPRRMVGIILARDRPEEVGDENQ